MAINNPYNQYKQNSVTTASPEELTLMLYNGAIKFVNIAKIEMEAKNIERTNEAIVRSQDIIRELNGSLNMNYPISENLRTLYTFILEKLIDANIQKDIKIIEEILPIIEEMRDTWKLVIEEVKRQKFAQGAR
ncbi:flagellar protein FliS [Gottschalkia acidurici 9a]|uniref:Flagellar secretion chaperone FliS n=1 Tax=Gottschalkia acidurici (strain ATCC 7906 / DSM 604 / BCRC 14475 / CIP 104303 / KCTC 5404 / NCIMB 10678 / 9a) TaxID=1128398 RepID=K0AX36_GOTA9|nr:flagellar export chaperone FliS [Gottschalkia acidurici]AFS77337.1 flagellar protein FliS [Gottschalkia acidurici 9a]